MENKSSLPAPAGLSPTEKAKGKELPLGGAPPVVFGGDNLAQQQERARQEAADAQMRATKEAEAKAMAAQNEGMPQPTQPQAIGARSVDETKRDIATIAEMAQVAPVDGAVPEEPPQEEPEDKDRNARAERADEQLAELDDFEWDRLRREVDESDFNNPQLRKKIEARCKEMELGDLVANGFATQIVPIVPGKLEVEFQTVKGKDDLTIKQMLYQEQGSDRYIFDKYSTMNLAAGLKAINRYPLPDHRDANGVFDRDLFNEKLECVLNYPLPMIGILSINFIWFDQRVRKLFTMEELGNGSRPQ